MNREYRSPSRIIKHLMTAAGLALAIASGSEAVAADKGIVRPAYEGLLEGVFQTDIVEIGLERLGYKIGTLQQLEIPSMHVAVAQGDADFIAVHWNPLQEAYFKKAGGDSVMTRLGTLVDDARQGYLIDKATSEKYGITNIAQFKDPKIAKIFDTDGSGKASLAGCPPGWGCERVIEHQLDAYGLRATVKHNQGQFMVMAADVISRYQAHQPVFYYTYTPLWVSEVLQPGRDVVWLEVPFTALPDADEQAHANTKLPDGRNVGFTVNKIQVVANNDFLNKHPDAKRWFELVTVPVEDVNSENAKIHDGEKTFADIRRHAEEWVNAHQSQFDAWVKTAQEAGN